jgi:CheY-like chemotaxis protein
LTHNTPHNFVILLVEDEPADAQLVKIAIRATQLPIEIHAASDGVDALEFLRQQGKWASSSAIAPRPDLILLDLNMPRMDGFEFLSHLKKDPRLAMTPVVVLTTSDAERDVLAAYQISAAGYVTKPVDMDQFTSSIRTLCEYWFSLVRLPARQA